MLIWDFLGSLEVDTKVSWVSMEPIARVRLTKNVKMSINFFNGDKMTSSMVLITTLVFTIGDF